MVKRPDGYDKRLGTMTDGLERERTFTRSVPKRYANDMLFTKTMHKG
jgi:hypothetical protein